MVEVSAERDIPLLVLPDRVATGLSSFIPVTANCALVVVTPPSKKS